MSPTLILEYCIFTSVVFQNLNPRSHRLMQRFMDQVVLGTQGDRYLEEVIKKLIIALSESVHHFEQLGGRVRISFHLYCTVWIPTLFRDP